MRLHILLSLSIAAVSMPAVACDCTKFPFRPEPPCESQCYALIANAASPAQLSSLGFSNELIGKIAVAKNKSQGQLSWDSYKKSLPRDDFQRMQKTFESITKDSWAKTSIPQIDSNENDRAIAKGRSSSEEEKEEKTKSAMEKTEARAEPKSRE